MLSCQEILNNLTKKDGGYQPINYLPHLTGWRRKRDYKRMLRMIIDYCGDVDDESFLDVGPCFGYFCFELTKMGARTTGVEYNKERYEVCQCLSKVYGFDLSNPKFINMDILDYRIPPDEKFEYVLMLNVFHYILERNTSEAWRMLNSITEGSQAVFITMAHERGLKAKSQDEIPDAIIRNSDLTSYKSLGKGRGRGARSFFVFWK